MLHGFLLSCGTSAIILFSSKEIPVDKNMEDAYRFIDAELKANPKVDLANVIDEASQKFDLNPMQTEFLTNKFILER